MGRTLPKYFVIQGEGDFLGYGLVSEIVSIAAQDTIAIAATIEGDLDSAEEMFKSVLIGARGRARDFPGSRHVTKQVPLHLAHVYSIHASREYWRWQRTRDRRHLEAYEAFVDKILEQNPQSLYGRLGRAITSFVLHKNMRRAWENIKACRGTPDGIWRYSEAFLYLYEGKLQRARA